MDLAAWIRVKRAASAALIVSIMVVAVALHRALIIDVLATAAGYSAPQRLSPIHPRPVQPKEAIIKAVAMDPFHPHRTRPADRYPLPSERRARQMAAADARRTRRSSRPPLRLTGTAVLPDGGGFAIFERGREQSTLIRLGESIAGLRLTRVGPGSALLVSADTALVLSLPKVGT